jgi:hypothetical protein
LIRDSKNKGTGIGIKEYVESSKEKDKKRNYARWDNFKKTFLDICATKFER